MRKLSAVKTMEDDEEAACSKDSVGCSDEEAVCSKDNGG